MLHQHPNCWRQHNHSCYSRNKVLLHPPLVPSIASVASNRQAFSRGACQAAQAAATQQVEVSVTNPEGGTAFQARVQVPAGAQLYQVALKKPLGFALTEQSPDGLIVVDDVTPSGHAAQAGVSVGDVLLAATARAQESGSSNPRLVLMQTSGLKLQTVAAGLRSNTCAQCRIVLLLQRSDSE